MSDKKTQAKIDAQIRRIEKKLAKVTAELPERVFAVYLEGWDDGRSHGEWVQDVDDKKQKYAEALKRIEARRGK